MAVDILNVQTQAKVGSVGPQANGALQDNFRSGISGELIVGHAHAKYYEAVSRGNVYMACNQTAVTFGTALTATGVTFHLSNTAGSPVDLVVLQTHLTVITCTTSGHIVYAANVNPTAAATVHGTALIVRNARLGGSAGRGLADSAATLPAAPVAVRALATGFFVGTTPAIVNVATLIDYVDGALVVEPGTTLSIQGITIVGTGIISMCWEEVPHGK